MARDLGAAGPGPDPERRRARATLVFYLGGLGILLLAILWSSRSVLFQPWTARAWVSGVAVDGSVYLAGGRGPTALNHAEVYRIDIARRSLRKTGTLPSPRFGTAVAVWGGRVVMAGGFDGKQVLDDLVVLDHGEARVQLLGRLPTPLAFAAAAAVDGEVYLAGGWDGSRTADRLLAVDPRTGAIRAVGRLPAAREHAAMAAHGGRLYLAGGVEPGGKDLDEVIEIDPEDASVLRAVRLPSARSRMAAVPVTRGVLLLGGWAGGKSREALLLICDEPELRWETLPTLPRGMSDFVAAVSGDERVYLLGGRDERLPRQIGITTWDPRSGASESVTLRGFLGL